MGNSDLGRWTSKRLSSAFTSNSKVAVLSGQETRWFLDWTVLTLAAKKQAESQLLEMESKPTVGNGMAPETLQLPSGTNIVTTFDEFSASKVEANQLLQYITKTVSERNIHEITDLIKEKDPLLGKSSETVPPPFAFVGLHTCGNLASMLIDLFLQSDATALVNVECCYHVEIEGISKKSVVWLAQMVKWGCLARLSECFHSVSVWKHRILKLIGQVFAMQKFMTLSGMRYSTNASVRFTTEDPTDPTVTGLTLAYRSVIDGVLWRHFSPKGYDFRVKRIPVKHYCTFSSYLFAMVKRFYIREKKGVGISVLLCPQR